MNIREVRIEEKEKWNEFVCSNQGGSFLQSWEWADFLVKVKSKVWQFVIEENAVWLAVCIVYKQDMKLGQSALYAPRGPVLKDEVKPSTELLDCFFQKIDQLKKQENVLTFEMDPLSNDPAWLDLFEKYGFEKTDLDMQPRHTLILDIRKSEQELLADMHQKTRYNIRLAEKKQITVEVDNSKFKEFYDLVRKTEIRQGVKFFSQDYFKKLLQVPFVQLYLANYEGKSIAGNIMIFWNNQVVYLFGASDYEFRNLMAPYLLQWQAIKDAKKQNIWFYDFWGAAPVEAKGKEQTWAGFTKFKMGFSPNAEITEYLGTYEKVYNAVQLGLYRYLRKFFKK